LYTCAASLMSDEDGSVNHVPLIAGSNPWSLPRQVAAFYCALPNLWNSGATALVPLQSHADLQDYWIHSFLIAYESDSDADTIAAYRARFKLKSITALQRTGAYPPFVALTAHKVGNLNWDGVLTPSMLPPPDKFTPVEVTRGTEIYNPNSYNLSYYSYYYLEAPGIESDCSASCPFFGVQSVDDNGNPTVNITQPIAENVAAIPGTSCFGHPEDC